MLKVLIVDDEITVRKGLIHGVDWQGMDCVVVGEAANGLEGLEAVENLEPDLIVTDVRMPRMNGIEMLTELRRRGSRVHVIVLTAYGEFDYVRGALQQGADDYLLKPFRDQELEAAVSRVRQKRSERNRAHPALSQTGTDKSGYVSQTVAYISRHFADNNISITTIAASLGVSEGHLSHVFKKETGSTVISYLTKYRIERAMELLRE